MPSKPAIKYTDLSTEDSFQFAFHCDLCDKAVQSEKYLFYTGSFERPPQGRARDLLWTRRHDEAYARASDEARFEFNVCPICGRRVCNECFQISADGTFDMCVDCKRAREKLPGRKPGVLKRLLYKLSGRRTK